MQYDLAGCFLVQFIHSAIMVRTTSIVWEHFKKIDEKKVKCNHCAKELVYTGGTGGELYICY